VSVAGGIGALRPSPYSRPRGPGSPGWSRDFRSFRRGFHEPSASVRVVSTARHGISAGWHTGCRCTHCRRAHSDTQRAFGRARAQKRLPIELRQKLLDAIYAGQPFRTTLRDLGLTPNQVWGRARTDTEWSAALESALMASRRDDLQHGTTAAYVRGCVCRQCREYQRQRMTKNRRSS
jgi:hypothetical protein